MKNCLILENASKEESSVLGQQVKDFLSERGISSEVFAYGMDTLSKGPLKVDFSSCDFVVTLGGDGTVLFASRECAPLEIPVFSINLGEFGFLASTSKTNWKDELDLFLNQKAFISLRSLIDVEVLRASRTVFRGRCLNDAVISSSACSGLLNVEVAFNRSLLGVFKSTGLIVSTSTGSTAYSAAAGGPIADPSLDAMILTPISSFSLSARPLVFGSGGEIAMTVLPSRVGCSLNLDGHIGFELKEQDVIILGISEHKARLVCATQEKFYISLKNKLNWSGGIRA